MSPTTEKVRKFQVLRANDTEMEFVADTICQVNDTYFKFKRDDKLVGELRGDVVAWWIEDGATGQQWTIDLPDGCISFIADKRETDGDKTIFKRAGEVVAVIFIPYHTWSTDG